MSDRTHVSIGQVKRDISDLVNRVANAHERIVLTSRGKPKAALVSMDDYARLESMRAAESDAWQTWLAEHATLNADILARREQKPVLVEEIWNASRSELEERNVGADSANIGDTRGSATDSH